MNATINLNKQQKKDLIAKALAWVEKNEPVHYNDDDFVIMIYNLALDGVIKF